MEEREPGDGSPRPQPRWGSPVAGGSPGAGLSCGATESALGPAARRPRCSATAGGKGVPGRFGAGRPSLEPLASGQLASGPSSGPALQLLLEAEGAQRASRPWPRAELGVNPDPASSSFVTSGHCLTFLSRKPVASSTTTCHSPSSWEIGALAAGMCFLTEPSPRTHTHPSWRLPSKDNCHPSSPCPLLALITQGHGDLTNAVQSCEEPLVQRHEDFFPG